MYKYLVLLLPFLVMGCANTVEVEDRVEYKCGEKVMMAELLDDDSMIVRIDGVSYVLNEAPAAAGDYYENSAAKVSVLEKGGDVYLSMQGQNYPLCFEIER